MNTYVRTPDMRIVLVLARLCNRYDKLYCYPSNQTVRELVFRFTGRSMSARTFWRHVGALVRDGWIHRLCRHSLTWLRSLGTNLWAHSASAAKSLIVYAMPELAQTLARESYSHEQRRRKPPPKR